MRWCFVVVLLQLLPLLQLAAAEFLGSGSMAVEFLRGVQEEYFPDCTLVVFRDRLAEELGSSFDSLATPRPPNPRLVFILDLDLPRVLADVDLKAASRCPVYVTLVRNATAAQRLFSLENRDWDKYFLTRRHVVLAEAASSVEGLLGLGQVLAMTDLLLVQPGPDPSSLEVAATNPYDPSGPRLLMTWRGEPLNEVADLFPDKLEDLKGHRMRVVTFHFPPRIFMEEQPDGSYLLYGVDVEVVRALCEALNFSVEFVAPTDGEMWGWEQENGSWTGLLGDLQRRRADIGVADLYIMEHYFAIVDMSVEYDIEYLCFVNPVPGALPQWMALGRPFALGTWVATFVTVLAGMAALAVLARRGFAEERQWFLEGANTSLLLFSCVVNAPWVRVPASPHLRAFVLLWSLAFAILAVAYRGSLVSYLTVPLERPPIDTHRRLYEEGVDVGSIGFTLRRVMEKNADPNVRRLTERYQHVPSTDEGLSRTVQGGFSFLESRGFLEYTIAVDYTDRRGRSSLHVMREYIAPFGIGLAFPKYVPYIAKFNRVIRRLTEAGLAKKWMADIIIRSKQARINDATRQQQNAPASDNPQDLAKHVWCPSAEESTEVDHE